MKLTKTTSWPQQYFSIIYSMNAASVRNNLTSWNYDSVCLWRSKFFVEAPRFISNRVLDQFNKIMSVIIKGSSPQTTFQGSILGRKLMAVVLQYCTGKNATPSAALIAATRRINPAAICIMAVLFSRRQTVQGRARQSITRAHAPPMIQDPGGTGPSGRTGPEDGGCGGRIPIER